jgi:small ligand-binding sensory domain FIST
VVLTAPTSTASARTFALSLRALSRRALASAADEATTAVALREPVLDVFRRTLVATVRQVPRPTGGIVFVSGVPSPAPLIARIVAESVRGLDVLVLPSSGILTENGEIEGVSAVAGIIWTGPTAHVTAGDQPHEVAASLDIGRAAPTLLAFHAADGFDGADVGAIARGRCVFGAGCPGPAIWAVRAGSISTGRVAAMRLEGPAPVVEYATASKLVTEAMVVTKMEAGLVLEIDGQPALDVLSAKAGGGRYGGLILVALHDAVDPARYLVRPLRGIDPERRSIAIAGDVSVGDSLSFAVRDAEASRDALAEAARRAERQILGSAPTFALFLSCAGRGRSLYGEPDADVRILKKRFPRIPIAGMHSAFEVVPWGPEEARMQLMSGVLALFRAPS